MKILVTGSNGNLARQISTFLTNKNYTIIGLDISDTNLNPCVDYYHQVDLSNEEAIRMFFKSLDTEAIPCFVLNVAAIDSVPIMGKESGALDSSDAIEMLKVNLIAPVVLTDLFANFWSRNNIKGRIINVSSMYARIAPNPKLYDVGFQKNVFYGASKAALESITKQSAVIFAKDNIFINGISMGGFMSDTQSKLFQERYKEFTPKNEMMTISSLFAALTFLLDEFNVDSIGSIVNIDGGYSLT